MLTVLLIEDDEIDAENVQRTLSKCHLEGRQRARGAQVIHTDYFEKALTSLNETEHIDIILLDLNLPDGNGTDLVRKLSNSHGYIPVIVLTGQESSEGLGVELVDCGAQDYIPKSDLTEAALTKSIQYAISRHKLNNKVKEQAQDLKFANEELETFTYIASHDLRSPLVNLKGFSSELKRSVDTVMPLLDEILPSLDENKQTLLKQEFQIVIPKAVDYIASSTIKMDRMTEAILQLSRLGRRLLTFEEIDTTDIVNQCIKAFSHQIQNQRAQIVVEHLPKIIGDRNAIDQIFSNLLDNALKYLDANRPGKITISATDNYNHIEFKISDNGRGIAEDDQHKVFEIFRRAGDVKDIAGEGMGMPFVRSLIKRHGGNIWFESEAGKGTDFYFTITKSLEKENQTNERNS